MRPKKYPYSRPQWEKVVTEVHSWGGVKLF